MTEENNRRTLADFEDYETKKRRKLRVTYNLMNRSFNDFKNERQEHWALMKNRTADGSQRINE